MGFFDLTCMNLACWAPRNAGKKAPHTKGVAGVTPDQATAVATYVAGLKK